MLDGKYLCVAFREQLFNFVEASERRPRSREYLVKISPDPWQALGHVGLLGAATPYAKHQEEGDRQEDRWFRKTLNERIHLEALRL